MGGMNMVGIISVSGGAYTQRQNQALDQSTDKDKVSKFDKAFQDAYIKKKSGNYTQNDQKRLKDFYIRTAETMDDTIQFRRYYGSLCRDCGLFSK